MLKKLLGLVKPLLKPLIALSLITVLVFAHADGAQAATRGGRIGGGSFRAPSRSYSSPARSRGGGYGSGYYGRGYGGGFGFPFLIPLFGFGGGFGGLFSILIMLAIANFLVRSFRSATDGNELGYSTVNTIPAFSVARLQVGLLAEARGLQADLNRIAETADTGSSAGLTQVLQEATLSLLRHPEYWAYAGADSSGGLKLEAAEQAFNQLAIAERSKFSEETVSNVNNQLKQATPNATLTGESDDKLPNGDGEYIVATILVATQGKLELPKVHDTQTLRRAVSQMGAVSSDKLMAVEILWAPQAEGETLSAEDLVVQYPDLKLV